MKSEPVQLELKQSGELFRRIFRALATPIVVSRLADGVIVEVNESWEYENGIAREDAIGRPGAAVGHWLDLEARARIVQQVKADGRSDNHIVRFRRRNGESRDVLVSCARIDLGGEPHLLWNSRDVTELRAAEAMARRSEQRFRALVELSSDFYWETDMQHRFTYRQGAILDRMGLPVASDIGKTRWELEFSNMTEADWAAHRAVLERREEFRDLLLQRPSADGRVHWGSISGRPLYDAAGKFAGYHGTGRDVTAQINAEWALRESETMISEAYEFLNDALENAPSGIALFDAQDRLVAWNSAYKKTFFSFNESLLRVGVDFRSLLREFEASGLVVSTKREGEEWIEERVRQHRQPSGGGELGLVDGRWFQVRETRTAAGRVASVYTDITALKEREAALRRLAGELESKVADRTAELAAANKDLEAFSYSVSHDLRAPLGAISGFAHLLRINERARLTEDGVHLLTMLEHNAERSVELIEGLLRFSRLGRAPVSKTGISMDELVRETVEELRRSAATASVELRIGRLPDCVGERMLLRQVWTNLLSNALKYSRGRNPAIVEVDFDATTGEYRVRDNGAGFDPRHAQKLFGVFERLHTEAEFEGTGVGLAIVKRIIERHGGSIRAEGVPGQGATFRFRLPA